MVEKPQSQIHADGHGCGVAEAKERKGLWSPEEDERLYTQITCHGVSTWSSVSQLAGLRRSGKSCRLRWMNYLRPDLKKEPISRREEATIISLQKSLGNRWSVIAARMPGRTDNEIKNYWNSRIRKRNNSRSAVDAGEQQPDQATAAGTFEQQRSALAPGEKIKPVSAVAVRLPVFACQLLVGGGAVNAAAGTQSTTTTTTTHEQVAAGSEESEMSGEDVAREQQQYYYCGAADMDMIDLLSFDDEYPAGDLLMDAAAAAAAPGGGAQLQLDDDPWESELYSANSGSSSIDFAC